MYMFLTAPTFPSPLIWFAKERVIDNPSAYWWLPPRPTKLWICRQIWTRFDQSIETIGLLRPYQEICEKTLQYFCWIEEKLQYVLQLYRHWRMSIRESIIKTLYFGRASVWIQVLLQRKNPTSRHTSLDKQVSLFPELNKSLVSMLITLKCRSSHRSKGIFLHVCPQSPNEHPGSDFTSQTRKTRNLPMQRKSHMRK